MNIAKRQRLLDALKNFCGQLSVLNKEISQLPVQGIGLVREDLGVRRNSHVAHGQKQKQPTMPNRITPPAGMGVHSDSPRVRDFYSEYRPGDTVT